MTEPRMRARQKGQQFATAELETLLHAYGAPAPYLPSTLTILDELITSYIIEICHTASLSAILSHRAKIKIDDFRFAFRNDAKKLGRMQQIAQQTKMIQEGKKAFEAEKLVPGEWEQRKEGIGRGRGRRKRKRAEGEDGDGMGEEDRGSEVKKGKKRGRKGKREKEEGEEDEEGGED